MFTFIITSFVVIGAINFTIHFAAKAHHEYKTADTPIELNAKPISNQSPLLSSYNENSTVNFGMHAGKLWSEVPTSFLELQVKKNTIYKSLCIKLLKSRKSEFKI
ncbi:MULTISPECIES: hypothetical protein [unclassified Pseudoalteromonas]|uniref:hypothetical protein n=1 Tax=unclassified Pseudoalteromonas TaxID=194690 RepID=UPI00040D10AC|nr:MULTISPECIES: hypothetical protein [unclassified Pseudoalteromonas]